MRRIWVRTAFVRLARLIGRALRWVNGDWRPAALIFLSTTFAVWSFEGLVRPPAPVLWSWEEWGKILGAYALLTFLIWLWRTRNRLIVDEFVDYASDQPKAVAKGVSTLLVIEIARLRNLYRDLDEQRAIPTTTGANKAIDAAIRVEETDDLVKATVSSESKFSLGPVSIPVGSFLAMFGRLARGPRVIGSVHTQGRQLIVTAQMLGKARAHSWRVNAEVDTEPGSTTLNSLIEELACRIFTDIASRDTIRWRALRAFTEGLQAYRDCLRTERDRTHNLIRAERRFIEAIAEDQQFDLAYYNLGVVYTELRRLDAAASAFTQAIRRRPDRAAAHYALAHNRYELRDFETAAALVDGITPSSASTELMSKAHHLKGLAALFLNRRLEALGHFENASVAAARALAQAELAEGPTEEDYERTVGRLRVAASQCERSFGVCHVYRDAADPDVITDRDFRQAELLLNRALAYSRADVDLHAQLGLLYQNWGKYAEAIRRFSHALALLPDSADYALYLCAAQLSSQPDELPQALERALGAASAASPGGFDWLAKVAVGRVDNQQLARITALKPLLTNLANSYQQGLTATTIVRQQLVAAARQQLAQHAGNDRQWERGHIGLTLSRLLVMDGQFAEGEGAVRAAIAEWGHGYSGEIAQTGARGTLAKTLSAQKKHTLALEEAQRAIDANPIRSFERSILGEVCLAVDDIDRAIAAWETALSWTPNDPVVHQSIAWCYWRKATILREPGQKKQGLERAATSYERALDLVPDARDGRPIHYWLGRLRLDLNDYPESIAQFQIARSLGEIEAPAILLGIAYLRNKSFDQAELQFQDAIEACKKRTKAGANLVAPVSSTFNDDMTIAEVLAIAHWGLAASHVERDVLLDRATSLLKRARRFAGRIPAARRNAPLAACEHYEGWILYKKDDVDAAIDKFERALALQANAECYLRLAECYAAKLRAEPKSHERQSWVIRGLACLEHVEELDLAGELAMKVATTRTALQPKPVASKAAAPTP